MDTVTLHCDEERGGCKSKDVDKLVDLRPYSVLWSHALGNDQKNEILTTRHRNLFSLKDRCAQAVGAQLSERDSFHIEWSQVRWFVHLMFPG